MSPKRKLILGSILLIRGIVSLVYGLLIYISLAGVNAILFFNQEHLYIFYYVFSRVLLVWGVALIVSGILIFLLVSIHKEFRSKKPMAAAIVTMVVGLALSGLFIYAVYPPPLNASIEMRPSAQFTEVGSDRSIVYNLSLYSNYYSLGYFNISLGGKNVFNQSFEFKGYGNTSYTVPSSTFSSPGNYSVLTTVAHGSSKKIFVSWTDVKPYLPMHVYVSGPTEATDGYTGNYSVQISGGYAPYQIRWYVYGQHMHELLGQHISFAFGDYYWGYKVEAIVSGAYGAQNTSSLYVYVVSNLSASFTAEYTQLDQYMTDVFNSSIYSGLEQTGVGPYSYSWYENGNLFSTSENSSYQFKSPGIYNISLSVKDSEGQISTSSQDVHVNPRFTLWSYGPFVEQITGSETVDFWYNVTGGTWLENVSGYGHYSVTFYVDGVGYYSDNSFFSNDIGHYEFTLSSSVLNSGSNTFEVIAEDGVGQTSTFSIEISYSS